MSLSRRAPLPRLAVVARLAPVLTGLAGLAGLASIPSACGSDAARECRVGADCASGACTPDGKCVRTDANASVDASADGATTDGGPTAPLDAGADARVPGCVPNLDGTITREEVPVGAGLHATYRIATDEDVDTAGTANPDGTRSWDLSGALASDQSVLVETQPLAGKWYAPKYSGATYASTLSTSSNLLGVFEASPATLSLRGVVSPDDGATKTELTNDPPVAVLSFPLADAKTWTTDTTVSGTASGFFSTYTEHYESQVDAKGHLKTPLGTFEVLRVRVVLTRTVGLLVTTIRTFAFVTECYGTVATITSKDNETDVEFTRAAEIRRIAP